jgi:catalase
LIEVGRIILTRNVNNYFAEIEQLAFSPSNFVPGIYASPDKMLQARLFSYPDTHHHRLGPNYSQIPVNCPLNCKPANYRRDGLMKVDENGNGLPTYFPNSFNGPTPNREPVVPAMYNDVNRQEILGDCNRYETGDEDNFSQPRLFFNKVLSEDQQLRLAENIALHMACVIDFIKCRALNNFYAVDQKLGNLIKQKLEEISGQTLPFDEKSLSSPASVSEAFSPPGI